MTTEIAPIEPQQNPAQKQQFQQQQKTMPAMTVSASWHPSSKSERDTALLNVDSNQQDSQVAQSILADPNIKFPLENSWSFHFYKNEKSKTWKENVKFITTVDFVEDFWGVYNHLQLVSKLNPGCDYMFFKKDIPPMWEDPQNCDGGRWVLNMDKKQRNSSLDVYWLNILLALIGDQFMEEGGYVNGVWVNIRPKGDKLSLWTKSAKNAELQMKIGRKLRDILGLKENMITFEEHDESSKKSDQSPLYKC